MSQTFRLYWLRENGCDTGTPLRAGQLDPRIQGRVLELANGDSGEFAVRLPFLDKREWRRRDEFFRKLALKRKGDSIVCELPVPAAMRDRAAHLALTHPAWTSSPVERDPIYFRVWQKVSLALQSFLRHSIAAEYFRDLQRFEEREIAYPMLAYQVARLYHGRESTEFAYDLRDYPERRDTLESTWKMTAHGLQVTLEGIERKLNEAGMPVLARRYAPVWFEDILVAVRRKPKRYVDLLARESMFINAVIDLGTERTASSVNRFARTAGLALRKVHGMDMRHLALDGLEEATRIRSEDAAAAAR